MWEEGNSPCPFPPPSPRSMHIPNSLTSMCLQGVQVENHSGSGVCLCTCCVSWSGVSVRGKAGMWNQSLCRASVSSELLGNRRDSLGPRSLSWAYHAPACWSKRKTLPRISKNAEFLESTHEVAQNSSYTKWTDFIFRVQGPLGGEVAEGSLQPCSYPLCQAADPTAAPRLLHRCPQLHRTQPEAFFSFPFLPSCAPYSAHTIPLFPSSTPPEQDLQTSQVGLCSLESPDLCPGDTLPAMSFALFSFAKS